MKSFILLILVCFHQNCEVTCFNFLNYMTNKFSEVTDTIKSAFRNVRNSMSDFMFPNNVKHQAWPLDMKSKIQRAFSDFVEEEAGKCETDSPEYNILRQEPTALMSTPQLATLHGKRIESHLVLTKDGYILTIHRIRNSPTNDLRSCNFTILMHHGLLGSSADWILLGAKKSLPYILSDAGCDVWLANSRGNYYSRGHITKNIDFIEFWEFSWQEMGQFDLPAVVDYIKKFKRNDEKINFIGHSMGATAFLVMLSTIPSYNNDFRMGILLAPLVYMSNVEGPLKVLTSMANRPPEQLLKLLGEGEFVPDRKIPLWIANKHCKGPALYCLNPLLFLSGSIPEENLWDNGLLARVLYHVPAGGSTNTILHYAQTANSKKFHYFNDQTKEFSLRLVTVPIVMFSSSDDWLATIPDVLRLYFSISNPIDHFIIRGKKLSHTDFVWHPEADVLVFAKVVECLENGNLSKRNEIN